MADITLMYAQDLRNLNCIIIKILDVDRSISEFLEQRGSYRAPNGVIIRPGLKFKLGGVNTSNGFPKEITLTRGQEAGTRLEDVLYVESEMIRKRYLAGLRAAMSSLASAAQQQQKFIPYYVVLY